MQSTIPKQSWWKETPKGVYSDMSQEDHEQWLIERIYEQQWKYAKTYDKTAPHEYIVYPWNKELFNGIGDYIDKYGWDTKYYNSDVRYGLIGNYRYWHYHAYSDDAIMNRARDVPVHMSMKDNYSPELREHYMKVGYIKGEA